MFERWGRKWERVRGYALVESEGWFLELYDITDDEHRELVLLARWPDGGELIVSQHKEGLDPEIVAWFRAEAQTTIAPAT